jgi:hypothetical protein
MHHTAGGEAATLQLDAGKDYVPVQGLAPGALSVAPWQAIYLIEDRSRGNKMSIGVREEETFSAWRLAGN